jgi:putative flippase GtrA
VPSAEALTSRGRLVWRIFLRELSAFGVVGAVCFVLDLGIFQLLYVHTGMGPVLAKLVSTVIATTVAYFGNRYWSFSRRARTGIRREYLLFFLINAVTLVLSLAVVAFVHHGLHQDSALVLQIANVGSIAVGTAIRFLCYRQWVFPAPALSESRSAA